MTLDSLAEQRVTRQCIIEQGFDPASLTAQGDTCAVLTDLVDDPYFLLLVSKRLFTAGKEGETGAYDSVAQASARVVRGRYFTQLPGDYKWALDGPKKEVVVYGHLIRFTPIPLIRAKRGKSAWSLDKADHEAILAMLQRVHPTLY